MKDKELKEFIQEHKNIFKILADTILCPSCNKMVTGDKFNLGIKFYWAEGCKACYEKENKNVR